MPSLISGTWSWSSGDPEPGWLPVLPLSLLASTLLLVSQSDLFLCQRISFLGLLE